MLFKIPIRSSSGTVDARSLTEVAIKKIDIDILKYHCIIIILLIHRFLNSNQENYNKKGYSTVLNYKFIKS